MEMKMDKMFESELLKKEIGKEVHKNILSGNNHFDILFKWSSSLEKGIKSLKPKFKELQIITHYLKEGEHLILSIDFGNSPVIKMMRDIYGIKTES